MKKVLKIIGIGGHSQGGVGTINAVNNWDNGKLYKAMYTASTTSPFWGQENQFGTDWAYDVRKITIPYFFIFQFSFNCIFNTLYNFIKFVSISIKESIYSLKFWLFITMCKVVSIIS